jgi:transposase
MNRATRYPAEVRERAVRMVFDHEREYDSQWAAISSISGKLGMTAETLRKWVRQAETDQGLRPGSRARSASASKSLSVTTASCGGPRRSSRQRRRVQGIDATTAAARDERLHRGAQQELRGRADLPGVADRPIDLLRARSRSASARALRDEPASRRDPPCLRAELPRLRRLQSLAAAEPRGHRGRPLHGRAPHARAAPPRRGARQEVAHDDRRSAGAQAGRPRLPRLLCRGSELPLAGRPDLRAHLGGLRLRGLRHRCLQPLHRRLAGRHPSAHRPRPGRSGDGPLAAQGRP